MKHCTCTLCEGNLFGQYTFGFGTQGISYNARCHNVAQRPYVHCCTSFDSSFMFFLDLFWGLHYSLQLPSFETFTLLGFYVVYIGSQLMVFQDNLQVSSSRVSLYPLLFNDQSSSFHFQPLRALLQYCNFCISEGYPSFFFDCSTLQDRTDQLAQNTSK